jgi:hypothetical protein
MCFDSGGKSKSENTVQTSAPYGPAQPGINKGLEDAFKLYKSGGLSYDYFPASTVAPTSTETADSWQMISDRARAGSPNLKAAQDYDARLLGGDFTALNPIMDTARNNINSNKSLTGRYGSDVHDRAITEGIGTIAANAQSQAVGRAPGLAQADYVDPQMLAGVGAQREGVAQDNLNDMFKRWQFEQEEPANEIQRLFDLSSGNWGGTVYGTQPGQKTPGTNPWMQGASIGAGLLASYLGS